jgi:hypothetical protein
MQHWFTPTICTNLEACYGLTFNDYESDEYRLKSRTDVYDFGLLDKSEHDKYYWWKNIVIKSKKEPLKFDFIKSMVYTEMKSYFFDNLYQDDIEFKTNFDKIFNIFLTDLIKNIIKTDTEYGILNDNERFDIASLKNGLKTLL